MTTFTIQNSLYWLRKWQGLNHRRFHLLFQYLNHIHHSTTFVLCLILGCMLSHFILYPSIILHCQRSVSVSFFFDDATTVIFWRLLFLDTSITHRTSRSETSACKFSWKRSLWKPVQFFTLQSNPNSGTVLMLFILVFLVLAWDSHFTRTCFLINVAVFPCPIPLGWQCSLGSSNW